MIKYITRLHVHLLISLVISNSDSIAQSGIDTALRDFNTYVRFEKAFVHFDNNKYSPAQTIWYKAYLLSGFQPSLISKNFYVDWYDDNNKIITSTVTPVIYSYSSGSFTIPPKYKGKFIKAIAYTRWMQNFDSSYFFEQSFPIIFANSTFEKINKGLHSSAAQFLPESGTMLSNKINVVAFKALNNLGRPENISGIVKNSKGDSITSFMSIHDGMGKFQFIPNSHESYSAIWTDMLGNTKTSTLPASNDSAVNLIVEAGSGKRIFHVQRTRSAPDRMKHLILVGQMNGIILFKANLNLTDKESFTSNFPVSKIPSGIVQLTIFDANLKPLCERLIFVKNNDFYLNTTLRVDTLNTSKRGKNVFEINLNDTTYTNLSISITDGNLSDLPSNNIFSQLLLKGDLTGNIYKPAYYFDSNNDFVESHLDLVMLTNGWRRYNWEEIMHNPIPVLKYPKEIGYLPIKGKILNYKGQKNKSPDVLNLTFDSKNSGIQLLSVPINDDGSFSINNAVIYDSAKVYFSVNNLGNLSAKKVLIESDLFKPRTEINQSFFTPESDTTGTTGFQNIIARQLTDTNKYHELKEVKLYSKEKSRIKELDLKYAKGVFTEPSLTAFDMSAIENASHRSSIFDFLNGKVPGLEIGNSIGGTATEGVATFRGGVVSFFLDETPLPTAELNNINLDNIAYIKVFDPPFIGGLNQSNNGIASGGAVAIYTKHGAETKSRLNTPDPTGSDYKIVSGYAEHKEFYTPEYTQKAYPDNAQDFRTTLLWNPWINLNKANPSAKIVFFNNDVSNKFRVIIEGMDGKGKLIYLSKLLK